MNPYQRLIDLGFPYERVKAAVDSPDNWGGLVHSVVYLSALGALLDSWPEELR